MSLSRSFFFFLHMLKWPGSCPSKRLPLAKEEHLPLRPQLAITHPAEFLFNSKMSEQDSKMRHKDLLKPDLTSDTPAVALPPGTPLLRGGFLFIPPAEPSSKALQAPLHTPLFSLAKRLELICTSAPHVQLPPRFSIPSLVPVSWVEAGCSPGANLIC